MSRGYYRNSLKSWLFDLERESKALFVRHQTMLKIKHPDANDQGILIEINREMREIVEAALRTADALERNSNNG